MDVIGHEDPGVNLQTVLFRTFPKPVRQCPHVLIGCEHSLPIVAAPWVWTYTFVLSISFALLAHLIVQISIWRMNYLEALKVKE